MPTHPLCFCRGSLLQQDFLAVFAEGQRSNPNPVPSRHPGCYLKFLPTCNNCVGYRDHVKSCMKGTTLREAKQRLDDKPDSRAAFTKCVKDYEQVQDSAGKCGRVTQASKVGLGLATRVFDTHARHRNQGRDGDGSVLARGRLRRAFPESLGRKNCANHTTGRGQLCGGLHCQTLRDIHRGRSN